MQSAHLRFRWYSRAARRTADVPGPIICLRLNRELCAYAINALGDTVISRLAAATAPTGTVVLDLSATATVDDQGQAALRSLHRRLAELAIRLRLVAPEPDAYATLKGDGTGIEPDALHTSVRAAVLAAHADLPGPAAVTPALRTLLARLPEPLPLAEVPGAGGRGQPVPAQRAVGSCHD
jgi:anti-anti-sigma regulatory factor